jgi:hypothetical protein
MDMSRPSSEFRIPTLISVAIATVFGVIAALLWRSASVSDPGGAAGYEGFGWLAIVLLAGAALVVAALALYFAEHRFVYWVGLVGLVLVFAL